MATSTTTTRRRGDDPDRTARARIRDAAIRRFAADGVAATNLKSIAADAGVSPPLVIHHFGSKEGVREECDRHVAALIRAQKHAFLADGGSSDPLAAIHGAHDDLPLLAYLARTIPDGSPHVAAMIDEMVEDAIGYLAAGEASGLGTPSDHPRERAAILTLWQLGVLVLHEHVARLLGADLTAGPAGAIRYWLPAAEILSRGVFDERLYETWRDAHAASRVRDESDHPGGGTP